MPEPANTDAPIPKKSIKFEKSTYRVIQKGYHPIWFKQNWAQGTFIYSPTLFF